MNIREPKTQILLVVALLFIVGYYFWFSNVFTPYNDQIAVKKTEKDNILEQLHQVEQRAATLPQLEKDLEELERDYQKVQLLLPDKKEDEAFLKQLHAAAQLTGSLVTNITPLGTIPSDFYQSNNYNVEVKSNYHGLGRFLARVANMPFIVNLSDISMKSPNTSLAGSSDAQKDDFKPVIATFKLSTYNVKQGPAG
jgi:type IV pilus assembly protein PilO